MTVDRQAVGNLEIGASASVTRAYAPADLDAFASLAGVAPDAMTAVPEPPIGALFSCLLGVKVPGRGTNYLKQDIAFVGPIPAGEALTATVTITRLRPDKHLCDLATVLTGADGRRLANCRALVLVKDVATRVEV